MQTALAKPHDSTPLEMPTKAHSLCKNQGRIQSNYPAFFSSQSTIFKGARCRIALVKPDKEQFDPPEECQDIELPWQDQNKLIPNQSAKICNPFVKTTQRTIPPTSKVGRYRIASAEMYEVDSAKSYTNQSASLIHKNHRLKKRKIIELPWQTHTKSDSTLLNCLGKIKRGTVSRNLYQSISFFLIHKPSHQKAEDYRIALAKPHKERFHPPEECQDMDLPWQDQNKRILTQ